MRKRKNKLLSLLLILTLVFLIYAPTTASAASYNTSAGGRSMDVSTYSLKTINDRHTYSYPSGAVYFSGTSFGNIARLINGEYYIPMRQFVNSAISDTRVTYNSTTRTLLITGGGHNISVSDNAYALYASGRVLFSDTPSKIMSDGRMYVPAKVVAKVFGLKLDTSSGVVRFSGTPSPILSGDRFYASDMVYWLSRIISAESRGEPLIGQIAVGNVVLNRTKSPYFPSTIYGVIFDRKYGVQFSPVLNGTIYDTPSSTAVLAAKICLDGFTVSPDALYFLRPSASSSSWIVNNRSFLFVIGNHYFFA